MRTVATEWRELVAGSEGFLIGKGNGGLREERSGLGGYGCYGEFVMVS